MSSYTPAKIMSESSAGYLTSDIGPAWIAGYGRGSGLVEINPAAPEWV